MKISCVSYARFLVLGLVFALSACAVVERLGDYVNDNPLVADLVVRQAVARYIDAGETDIERVQRATDVRTVIERTQSYLRGNPVADVSDVVEVINSQVNWERLSAYDRLLVQDIMLMVQVRLEEKQMGGELSDDALLAVRALLQTAASAARLFG